MKKIICNLDFRKHSKHSSLMDVCPEDTDILWIFLGRLLENCVVELT